MVPAGGCGGTGCALVRGIGIGSNGCVAVCAAAAGGGAKSCAGGRDGGGTSGALVLSRFHAPLMKDQASAGRLACGVVRTITPLAPPSVAAWAGSVAAGANGSSSICRLGQGPAAMASRSGCRLLPSACGGSSPIITTASRLCASNPCASWWRVCVSASICVV